MPWVTLIINLLNTHLVHLVDKPELWLIHMQDASDGQVHWQHFVVQQ